MENTTALLTTFAIDTSGIYITFGPNLPDIPLTQVKHGNTALLATTFFMILCCLGLHCFQMFLDIRKKKKTMNNHMEYHITSV